MNTALCKINDDTFMKVALPDNSRVVYIKCSEIESITTEYRDGWLVVIIDLRSGMTHGFARELAEEITMLLNLTAPRRKGLVHN